MAMANQEHLDILKLGVEVWNLWHMSQPTKPDFIQADLSGVALNGVILGGAALTRANLSSAVLSGAVLSDVDLGYADLKNADLRGAYLINTNLKNADLRGATLRGAVLERANLSMAILIKTDLTRAHLSDIDLRGARLNGATLTDATVNNTIFGNVDLRYVIGLETVQHIGPSEISMNTIYRSQGDIPEIFLRGAGVPASFIEYMRSLVVKPIDYYTCFISYSSRDQTFAKRLYADLQQKGVRCWFAPHDMHIGDKIRPRIDESIRLYDKLLLVLSEHSVQSQWVEHEVEMALAKERIESHNVLFPIRLDETILEMEQDGWPSEVRHTRHIGDFTRWKQHDDYQQALERLLRDLKVEV